MADAEKREKVIRGLEAHANFIRACTTNDGAECPYYNDGDSNCFTCSMMLSFDALALLREQEPRVMDADEVFVTERGTVLYLERRRSRKTTTRIVSAILTKTGTWNYATLSSYRYAEFVYEGKLIDERDFRAYGVTWRCWTSHPTTEQIRDTPWEEVRRET